MKSSKAYGVMLVAIVTIAGGPAYPDDSPTDEFASPFHGEHGKNGDPLAEALRSFTISEEEKEKLTVEVKKKRKIQIVVGDGSTPPAEEPPGAVGGQQTDGRQAPENSFREVRDEILKDAAQQAVNQRKAQEQNKERLDQVRKEAQQGLKNVNENIEAMNELLDNTGGSPRQELDESALDMGPSDTLGEF